MKNLAIRGIAGLCVAAGSLTVGISAQAAYSTSVSCSESDTTTDKTKNPSYVTCDGPKEGLLSGTASELTDLTKLFGKIVGSLPFTYRGKSSDVGGPFLANPMVEMGTLVFNPLNLPTGAFVLGFEGGDSNNFNNFSYYLFKSSTPTASIQFDTLGITDSSGMNPGPPLAFATLYVQQPQGGGVVPEPASVGLLAAAFGALALATRRRG